MNQTATLKFDLTPPTEEEFTKLAVDLDEEERLVLLEHSTEAPFCDLFLTETRPGVCTRWGAHQGHVYADAPRRRASATASTQ